MNAPNAQRIREVRAAVLYLESSQSAPLHDVVTVVARECRSLHFEDLAVLLGDWGQQFRLESQAQIESALLRAMEARAE